MFTRVGGHCLRRSAARTVGRTRVSVRKFSAPPNSTAASSSSFGPLGSITVELDRIAPRFEIAGSQVTVLDSPSAFYDTLKVRKPLFFDAAVLLTSITGENTQCKEEDISLYFVHREIRI